MTTKSTKLYFVALIPSGNVYERSLALKKEVAERFDSRAALRSPPHITLHMPFQFPEGREEKLSAFLNRFASDQKPLLICHDGFGSFAPRVIFVQVKKTEELSHFRAHLVREMRRKLNLDNADYKDQGFHPHMTIAFRDLKKSRFGEAWEYYEKQDFKEEWVCDAVALLKHNGKKWEVVGMFRLNGSVPSEQIPAKDTLL